MPDSESQGAELALTRDVGLIPAPGWTYGQYVEAGLRVEGVRSWLLGDLAAGLATIHGERTLRGYADDIGVSYSTLRSYMATAGAFPQNVRRRTISFAVPAELAAQLDRWELIARPEGWTREQARALVQERGWAARAQRRAQELEPGQVIAGTRVQAAAGAPQTPAAAGATLGAEPMADSRPGLSETAAAAGSMTPPAPQADAGVTGQSPREAVSVPITVEPEPARAASPRETGKVVIVKPEPPVPDLSTPELRLRYAVTVAEELVAASRLREVLPGLSVGEMTGATLVLAKLAERLDEAAWLAARAGR